MRNGKCTREYAVETYNRYFGDHASVVDLSTADPMDMPKADILLGGFPCQDFSSCGPLRGLTSERGRLYQTMINYMNVHKPKVVIGENVLNLKRMEEGAVINTIILDYVSDIRRMADVIELNNEGKYKGQKYEVMYLQDGIH